MLPDASTHSIANRARIKLASGTALAVSLPCHVSIQVLISYSAYLKSLTSALNRALDMYSGIIDPPEPKVIYLSVPSKTVRPNLAVHLGARMLT